MAQSTDLLRGDEGSKPGRNRRSPPWPLFVAIAVAVAVLAPAVVYLTSRDEGRRTASVNVLKTAVELRRKADDAFRTAQASAEVDVGDVVRTDTTGMAELEYWNGSFTRLAPSTSIEIKELVATAGRRSGRTQLDDGRLWNRVSHLTSNRERYEVESPNSLAAVRGTGFDVNCSSGVGCVYTVVAGEVGVEPEQGESRVVRENERLTVDEEGNAGPIEHVPDSELARDPWIADNVERDQELGAATPAELADDGSASTPAPDPSASASSPPTTGGTGSGAGTAGTGVGGSAQPAGTSAPTPRGDPFDDPFFAEDPDREPRDRDPEPDETDAPTPEPEPTPPETPGTSPTPPPVD